MKSRILSTTRLTLPLASALAALLAAPGVTGNPTVTLIGGGTLQLGGAGKLGNGNYAGAISIADGATFENAGAASQTLSGAITGTGGTVKLSDNGQLILSHGGTLSFAKRAAGVVEGSAFQRDSTTGHQPIANPPRDGTDLALLSYHPGRPATHP